MLPKCLREKLAARFDELLKEAKKIRQTIDEVFDKKGCLAWMTKCTTLLSQVIPHDNPNRAKLARLFKGAENATPATFPNLVARLRGIQDDFDRGFLDDLAARIEQSIAADYMGQAEQLMTEGQSGKYDHVPAAVLVGAVLEKAFRSLCDRQTPPIAVAFPNGKRKTLNTFIDDLKKANVYNETKAKQLRAWASIRNHAAHGEFDQFNRNEVQGMIAGVRDFLKDYL